jgi:hypothetical protein
MQTGGAPTSTGKVLCTRVLENHGFLDPEIERSIAARDDFYRRCTTASLFKMCITKKKSS